MRRLIVLLALASLSSALPGVLPATAAQEGGAQEATPLPSIADKAEGMDKNDGFIPLYWDARTGLAGASTILPSGQCFWA